MRRDREAERAGRIEAQAGALAEHLQRAAAPTAVTTAATTGTGTSRQMGLGHETFIVMIQRGRESQAGVWRAEQGRSPGCVGEARDVCAERDSARTHCAHRGAIAAHIRPTESQNRCGSSQQTRAGVWPSHLATSSVQLTT